MCQMPDTTDKPSPDIQLENMVFLRMSLVSRFSSGTSGLPRQLTRVTEVSSLQQHHRWLQMTVPFIYGNGDQSRKETKIVGRQQVSC